uniref:ATP synthase complex subunit 8 n=1 Tax=Tripteroides tasmaniensis TaxID=1806187 RepID=A0A7T0CPT5_9DIPT|nr:ATP synthase F0 subunit 8 [Tripteroides tasmaniensis]QPJ78607.1 ATP synthase F0 subunit 8 [Tripteroides tasmaniensis]
MPQMAPISWLTLFIIFSITLVVFNVKTFYCLNMAPQQLSQSISFKQNKMNWKW